MSREEIQSKIDATRLKNLRAQRALGMFMKPVNVKALERLEAAERERKNAARRQKRQARREAVLSETGPAFARIAG